MRVNYGSSYELVDELVPQSSKLYKMEPSELGIHFSHEESPYNDFAVQPLLPHKLSHQGNFMSSADINSDGLENFYIGGAADQSGALFLQTGSGFEIKNRPWKVHKASEDIQSIFFDYDNDQDLDLYVVRGSYEFQEGDEKLQDRLYQNDGKGNFQLTNGVLPEIRSSGSTVQTEDIDGDGDQDIFIGGRVIQGRYPLSPRSYLLENVNGKFIDITSKKAPQLSEAGMMTDAVFSDFDGDDDPDLIVVGEWSAIHIFENTGGKFNKISIPNLANTVGLWFSLGANDIDEDGDDDYFIGNLGLNSKFKVEDEKEFHIYSNDFDNNGSYDKVL